MNSVGVKKYKWCYNSKTGCAAHLLEDSGGINVLPLEKRFELIKQYGSHAMSFSMLQPGMQYYDVPGLGFIAFKTHWGRRFVLADPVCAADNREKLIRLFLNNGNKTSFIQISQDVAELLHLKFGQFATQIGVESFIKLDTWGLKGKKKQVIRTSINHAKKEGLVITEEGDLNSCMKVSAEWFRTRTVKYREIAFLIRPVCQPYDKETRKFYAYYQGKLVGFAFFDPIYLDNHILGYVPNISRFSNRFKHGLFYVLMTHAMTVFKNEGINQLSLGLSPAILDPSDLPYESKPVKNIIRLFHHFGNRIYCFKGLHFAKSRFQGIEKKTFCAHEEWLPLKSYISLLRLTNII